MVRHFYVLYFHSVDPAIIVMPCFLCDKLGLIDFYAFSSAD